jgi:hypothetical protein
MISCAMETVLVSSIETALSLFIRDQVWGDERCTLSILKYLSPLIVFYDFDHSSYSKSYESIIYFVCYILYYSCYFNLNLLFYTFRIFFLNKMNDQSCMKKSMTTNILIWKEYFHDYFDRWMIHIVKWPQAEANVYIERKKI